MNEADGWKRDDRDLRDLYDSWGTDWDATLFWAQAMVKWGKTQTAVLIFVVAMLVGVGYLRHTGLPAPMGGWPHVGRFLRDCIGIRMVVRLGGGGMHDFVVRGSYVRPPPPDGSTFWNVMSTWRIVRGESYDTNGAVVASVRNGNGTIAVFHTNGAILAVVPVSNGVMQASGPGAGTGDQATR